jgi:hypothetical protein
MPNIKVPTNIARAKFLVDMISKAAMARKKPIHAIMMIYVPKVRNSACCHILINFVGKNKL